MGACAGICEVLTTQESNSMQAELDHEKNRLKLAYREIAELKDKLAHEKLYLEEEIRTGEGFEGIVGESSALRQVLQLAETVATSDSTVLLLGETGTGKELVARAIHDRSRRKDRTFVKLNCAAIPTGLLESELFGHERGAFTGAVTQKIGRLELADQGTLLLDEVGDIPLELQPKLLRVLQDGEFERLGSTRTKKVDVRLVAATNRDLDRMIEERQFRSDLYYRLNVFPIRVPPLRERPEDIPLLCGSDAETGALALARERTRASESCGTCSDPDAQQHIGDLGTRIGKRCRNPGFSQSWQHRRTRQDFANPERDQGTRRRSERRRNTLGS